MIVNMTEQECKIADYIAKHRMHANKKAGITDRQYGNQDPFQIEYDGVLSEMAVAKKFNVYPDFTVYVRKGSHDLLIRNLRVDVKSSRYPLDKFTPCISIGKKVDDCDLYVFTLIDENQVTIVGCIESKDAIKPENIGSLGHGDTYLVPVDKLKQI
jgi:hypothetical protein